MAFKVKYHQISGPDWIASERFDINATLPEGTRRDQLPEMMQTLLTDRFEMKHHRTSKEFPVYGLVVAKGGLKIAEIAAAEDATEAAKKPVEVSVTGSRGGTTVNYGNGSAFSFGDNKFQAKKVTMANVADTLARFVDRPVVDMTGLKGIYDFNLEFQPEDFQAMIIRSAITAGITLPPQAIQLMERASGEFFAERAASPRTKAGTNQIAEQGGGHRSDAEDPNRELTNPAMPDRTAQTRYPPWRVRCGNSNMPLSEKPSPISMPRHSAR